MLGRWRVRLAPVGWGACVLGLPLWAAAQASFTYGATPWPQIPEPPRSQVQWVSDDMRINGVPMRVQRFESEASTQEVIAHYQAHWRVGPGPQSRLAVTPAGDDTLLGQPHGPFYLMVKLRRADGGGSEGTLSVSRVQGIQARIDASGIPAPGRGAQAVNVVESIDAGKRSKQVLWLGKDSASAMAASYHASLLRGGWTLLQEQNALGGPQAAVVRMYGRGRQQMDVAIGTDAERQLTVMNTNLVAFD